MAMPRPDGRLGGRPKDVPAPKAPAMPALRPLPPSSRPSRCASEVEVAPGFSPPRPLGHLSERRSIPPKLPPLDQKDAAADPDVDAMTTIRPDEFTAALTKETPTARTTIIAASSSSLSSTSSKTSDRSCGSRCQSVVLVQSGRGSGAQKEALVVPARNRRFSEPFAGMFPTRTEPPGRAAFPAGSCPLEPHMAKAPFAPEWTSEGCRGQSRDDAASAIKRQAFNKAWRDGNIRENFAWCESDELGRGAFGRVFRGTSKYSQRKSVAIKQIPKKGVENIEELLEEISVLSELDHPNVLRLLEAYSDARHVYVITEVCLGGSLNDWLPETQGDLSFAERVTREIIGALAHCHSRGICHRDLKPANILMLRDDVRSPVRVADFGLAKRCSKRVLAQRMEWSAARSELFNNRPAAPPNEPKPLGGTAPLALRRHRALVPLETAPAKAEKPKKQREEKPFGVKMFSVKGTPEYMAPEVLRVLDSKVNKPDVSKVMYYDFRCDIWSLGMIVHQMITGRMPYSVYDVSFHVAEGAALPPLDREPFAARPRAADFIEECLCPDFKKRASAEELLKHAWLTAQRVPATPSTASHLMGRLRCFANLSQFKRAALLAAVRHLSSFEHEQLRQIFEKVDTLCTGAVSADRLREVCEQAHEVVAQKSTDADGSAAPDARCIDLETAPAGSGPRKGSHGSEAHEVVAQKSTDADGSAAPDAHCIDLETVTRMFDAEEAGEMDYSGFLAAIMDHRLEDRQDLVKAVYAFFDSDADGTVSLSDLECVLDTRSAKEVLEIGDTDGDGELSFEEFLDLLRRG